LTNDLQTVLKAIAISAVWQALLSPWTLTAIYPVRDHLAAHPLRVFLWATVGILVFPTVGGTIAGRFSDWIEDRSERPASERRAVDRFIQFVLPQAAPPSVWDSLFNKPWFTRLEDRKCFIILDYQDGTRLGVCLLIGCEGIGILTTPPTNQPPPPSPSPTPSPSSPSEVRRSKLPI
jgi:hypothetical protein